MWISRETKALGFRGDVSEVKDKKGWADFQGNKEAQQRPGHLPCPSLPVLPGKMKEIQRAQGEFFLKQYNPVIAEVCLHCSAV